MAENREYRSDVFSMLLEDPKNALDVYNALNGTDYDNPDMVVVHMLEKGVSLSIRNDASFIVDANLNLYEHQSTYSPNIPLRNLIYFTNLVRGLIKGRDLYGRRLIKIPTPHFAVFYNGIEHRPETELLCLSDSFKHGTDQPEIELKCIVYNINEGNNAELLERCKVLREYMYFVDKVRYYKEQYKDKYKDKGHNLTQAIEAAIDDCISHHILEEFFRQRRAEVVKVMQLDYTWEQREKMIRAEEYQDGLETGIEKGRREGRSEGIERGETLLSTLLQKLLAAGRTEDVEKMASDKAFREQLFKEFGMKS